MPLLNNHFGFLAQGNKPWCEGENLEPIWGCHGELKGEKYFWEKDAEFSHSKLPEIFMQNYNGEKKIDGIEGGIDIIDQTNGV